MSEAARKSGLTLHWREPLRQAPGTAGRIGCDGTHPMRLRIMTSIGSKGDSSDKPAPRAAPIKNELVKRRTFTTRDQVRLAIFS